MIVIDSPTPPLCPRLNEGNNQFNAYNFAGDDRIRGPRYSGGHVPLRRRRQYDGDVRPLQCVSLSQRSQQQQPAGRRGWPITCHNYVVNFGNTITNQPPLFAWNNIKVPFLGAPFTDIGAPDADITAGGQQGTTAGTVKFSAIPDGLSNTLMTSEILIGQGWNLHGFSWWGYAPQFTGLYPPNSSQPDVMQGASYCNSPNSNPQGVTCVGATGSQSSGGLYTGLGMVNIPRSRHPGGVNAGMCDGSVRFIKNSISIPIFQALSSARVLRSSAPTLTSAAGNEAEITFCQFSMRRTRHRRGPRRAQSLGGPRDFSSDSTMPDLTGLACLPKTRRSLIDRRQFDEPIPMISQTAVVKEIVATDSAGRGAGGRRLRAYQLLVLSLWCGLVAGTLEVGAIVLRKHTFDLNQFYWMSRHFVWLIPLTNLLIFLSLGMGSGSCPLWPRRGRWLGARLLCVLTLLAPLWAAFPRIYGPAAFLLALGIAARLVPILERHADTFRRCVMISFPVLAAVTPLLAASVWAGDWLKERSEAARPLPPAGSPNVMLIVLDTVAAGHLSLHGYDRPTSPTLEGLARRGSGSTGCRQPPHGPCRPTPASSPGGGPTSCPSAGSRRWMQLIPRWRNTWDRAVTPRPGSSPTHSIAGPTRGWAAASRSTGITSSPSSALKPAALVDRPVEGLRALHHFLRERASLVFLAELIKKFDAGFRKPAAVVNREILGWLSSRPQPERPFFAFMNYYDVHYPYSLQEGGIHRFAVRPRTDREIDLIEKWKTVDKSTLSVQETTFARDSYDDCIANLDEQLGLLIDELERRGVLESTWLIITSDHGESFGEQPGVFLHGTSLYQPQVHVPLVIVPPPGSPRPSRPVVSENVSVRDLPATVVDLLDLEAGAPFPGQSLARLWERDNAARGSHERSAGFSAFAGSLRSGPDEPS